MSERGCFIAARLDFQVAGLWASLKHSGKREEELACSCVWHWRRPWMSCSGKCRSSVLEPLFDTFPPLMNFSLFSLFIFRNYNLIYLFCEVILRGLQKPFLCIWRTYWFLTGHHKNYIWLTCTIERKNKIHTCIYQVLLTLSSRPRVMLGSLSFVTAELYSAVSSPTFCFCASDSWRFPARAYDAALITSVELF